jgi:two-component system NarL family response regulator
MSNGRIRVMCVDDHRIVRDGIALIVARQPNMDVVGVAGSGEEAVNLFRELRPDVTLMDLQLGSMSGVEAIRAIRHHDAAARIIVLTMYQGDEDVYRALHAGAATYLLKDTLSDDLIHAIEEVHSGQNPKTATVEATLALRASRPSLSAREVQVIELVARGLRNREIAVALGISEETIQVHIKNIFVKIDAKDRTEAAAIAVKRGIIQFA